MTACQQISPEQRKRRIIHPRSPHDAELQQPARPEDLKKITAPTLILHGLNDKVCLFPLAEAQKAAIPHAKLVPFEACGHFLFYDQKDRFNKELIAFAQ